MDNIAKNNSEYSNLIKAALFILALRFIKDKFENLPTISQVIDKLGVSRSRTYEIVKNIEHILSEANRTSGRPEKNNSSIDYENLFEISSKIRDFLIQNPGAVIKSANRTTYTDAFRVFIIELLTPLKNTGQFTFLHIEKATGISSNTLKVWFADKKIQLNNSDNQKNNTTTEDINEKNINENNKNDYSNCDSPAWTGICAKVIYLWENWKGNFTAFCSSLEKHRIYISTYKVSQILALSEKRCRKRRKKTDPFPEAIRNSLETFFPNAQIGADGHKITITLNNIKYSFCWELAVDYKTGAHTGFSIRDAEDSKGVLYSLNHSFLTTGAHPQAFIRDNRPSNFTDEIENHLKKNNIISMSTTLKRPQNDSPIEGAFGLFSQTMPEIEINAFSFRELARNTLYYILYSYCAGRNHVKRAKLKNRTPIRTYNEDLPNPEEIKAARKRLLEIKKRIVKQQTEERKRTNNAACIKLLEDEFDNLGLKDPNGTFITAIAKCGIEAVTEALAIFKTAAFIPDNFPERYLLGIAVNVKNRNHDYKVYDELLRLRRKSKDLIFDDFEEVKSKLKNSLSVTEYLKSVFNNAVKAQFSVDRNFWFNSTFDSLTKLPEHEKQVFCKDFARKIASQYSLSAKERDYYISRFVSLACDFQC